MTFLCIGHRGAMGHAPENTLKSFELALEMGCACVELDVYSLERDGNSLEPDGNSLEPDGNSLEPDGNSLEPDGNSLERDKTVGKTLIVIHDKDLKRTTNGSGRVMDQTFDYLRSLDAGDGQQIPTLQEVIDLVDRRAVINVELKGRDTAQPVNQLLGDYLDRGWEPDDFLISSFRHQELAKSDPRYRRGALFGRSADYLTIARQLNAWSVNLDEGLVSRELVQEIHDAGFKVLVYTVNTRRAMQKMKDLGVDGVFTNFPDRCPG